MSRPPLPPPDELLANFAMMIFEPSKVQRFSFWLFDRATNAEPVDNDDKGWPRTWRAWAWSTAGVMASEYVQARDVYRWPFRHRFHEWTIVKELPRR